uniref:Uncharacterized protein n=1 Tax=Aegilops tauschii TaxID=37682 RepID=M8BSB3_AEGTA
MAPGLMWPRATAATAPKQSSSREETGSGFNRRRGDPGWWSCIRGEGSYKRLWLELHPTALPCAGQCCNQRRGVGEREAAAMFFSEEGACEG